MSTEKMIPTAVDPEDRWMYRVGGISALAVGIGYLITIPLYAYAGPSPNGDGGEAWLTYAAGKTSVWWAILGLSVLTDVLFLPVALSLYLAFQRVGRSAMVLATAFVLLFVVLDLAVTWSNYAALITLSGHYDAASTAAQRAAYVAAATCPTAVLASTLEAVFSIAILALGTLMTGLVMLRTTFSRTAAYVGVATGILGIASVAGPLLAGALSATIYVASVFTTLWVLLVGYRLYRLGRQ